MSKHTPGPWFLGDWSQDNGPNKTTIEAQEPEVIPPGGSGIWPDGVRCMKVASVEDSSFDEQTTAANARLIAAAPDLLEALKEAERFVNCHSEDWYIAGQTLLAKIRAAISKATGGK